MGARRTIRQATAADEPALRTLLAAHDSDASDSETGVEGGYLRHLVANHRVLVSTEDERVVAFGGAVDTGRCRMLSDLFVQPGRLGQGIGRPLLARLLGAAARRATFASADPRALPLYVRAGMTPLWVNLYLEGPGRRLPDPASSITVRSAGPPELARLEAAWLGAARETDHAYWAAQPAADPFVVEQGGHPVAVGHARAKPNSRARVLDRLVVAPGADPVAAAIAGLVRAAHGGHVHACVPGPNPLLPILLDAGFRVVDQDQFLASHPDIVDPARLLPSPGLL